MNLKTLLRTYDAVVIFDTETSGLDANEHQIIELAAIRVEKSENGTLRISDSMDDFIRLPEGETLRTEITELTHITDEMLQTDGKEAAEVADRFHELIEGDPSTCCRVLMVAHNAQFDLLFVRQLLKGHRIGVKMNFLDTLTVFKDRASYPHKLEAAIKHYKLEGKVKNSHRAIDDTCALLEVMKAMDAEREDLHTYVDIFGYHPRHNIQGDPIRGVTYWPQHFNKGMVPPMLTLPELVSSRWKEKRK